jgi:hypothetical protein
MIETRAGPGTRTPFSAQARCGFAFRRNPQIHKHWSPYYWFCIGHTGLYAPRMPTLRPQNAEQQHHMRPWIAEENSASNRRFWKKRP